MERPQLRNIGPKRGAAVNKRWNPKEWHPIYEQIVLYDAIGMPHAEIEEKTGYTQPWISSILNSEQGKLRKILLTKRIQETGVQAVTTERVQKLQARAFQNIEKVINNDDILERSPMAIFGASMDILKKHPIMYPEEPRNPSAPHIGTVNVQQNFVQIPGAGREEINRSLELAGKVQEIHQLPAKVEDE